MNTIDFICLDCFVEKRLWVSRRLSPSGPSTESRAVVRRPMTRSKPARNLCFFYEFAYGWSWLFISGIRAILYPVSGFSISDTLLFLYPVSISISSPVQHSISGELIGCLDIRYINSLSGRTGYTMYLSNDFIIRLFKFFSAVQYSTFI